MLDDHDDGPPPLKPDHDSRLQHPLRLTLFTYSEGAERPSFMTMDGERLQDRTSSLVLRFVESLMNAVGRMLLQRRATHRPEIKVFSACFRDRCHVPTLRAFTEGGSELNCFLHSSVAGLLNRDNHRDSGYRHTDDVTIFLPTLLPKRRLSQLHFNAQTLNAIGDPPGVDGVCNTAWKVVRRDSPSIGEYAAPSTFRNAVIPRESVVVVGDQVAALEQHTANETTRLGLFPIHSEYFGLRRLPRAQTPVASAIYLGTNLDFLFYEALVYGLPKLAVALRTALDPDTRVILNDYMHPAVESLFRKVLVEQGHVNEILKASRLVELHVDRLTGIQFNDALRETTTDSGTGLRAAAADILRTLGYGSLHDRAGGATKIWVTRGTQARNLFDRVPVNVAEIEAVVRRHGYTVIDPGTLSMERQIQTFAGADVVASLHGGALANLLWCRPGTRVLEVFTSWIDPCFEQLSQHMGLVYRSLRCDFIPAKSGLLARARHHLPVGGQKNNRVSTLDLAALERALC